jgi:hypothetical protein
MSTSTAAPYGRPHSWHFLGCDRGKRYSCGLPATCRPVAAWLDRDFIWPATITDLSTSGLGIVLGRRFEPGAGLAVELPASADRCEETFLVKVLKVYPMPGGHWLLGCTFVSALSEETVETLVHQGEAQKPEAPAEAPATNGRAGTASTRTGLEKVVANVRFCVCGGDGSAVWFTGRRVYPRLAWPLEAGARLRFRFPRDGARDEMTVVIEHCEQQQGRWIVYCTRVDGAQPLPAALAGAEQSA